MSTVYYRAVFKIIYALIIENHATTVTNGKSVIKKLNTDVCRNSSYLESWSRRITSELNLGNLRPCLKIENKKGMEVSQRYSTPGLNPRYVKTKQFDLFPPLATVNSAAMNTGTQAPRVLISVYIYKQTCRIIWWKVNVQSFGKPPDSQCRCLTLYSYQQYAGLQFHHNLIGRKMVSSFSWTCISLMTSDVLNLLMHLRGIFEGIFTSVLQPF